MFKSAWSDQGQVILTGWSEVGLVPLTGTTFTVHFLLNLMSDEHQLENVVECPFTEIGNILDGHWTVRCLSK